MTTTERPPTPRVGPLNVLQVSHRYPPAYGGIENYAHRLTESLQGRGHEVAVVTTDLGTDGTGSDDYPEATYCRTTATVQRNPISVDLYRRLRRTGDADLCHLHSPYMLPSLEAARALPGSVPTVVTVHGFPPAESALERVRNRAYRPLAQYVYDRSDAIVVLGESERDRLLGHYDVDPGSVTVIPNGIDPDACDVPADAVAAFQREYGLDPETPTVLLAGRLVPLKNPDALVAAVTNHLPDVDLDVLVIGEGDPEYVRKLKSAADDRFTFLHGPPRPVLLRAYHASDLFVLLSNTEGLSTVLLEAMNARLPVVTTAAGGVADVIDHREHGWIVDLPPEPAAVAAPIRYYCAHDDRRRRVGERNRAYVRAEFAWSDISDRIIGLYERLVDGRSQ